jgi:hypothetical protein
MQIKVQCQEEDTNVLGVSINDEVISVSWIMREEDDDSRRGTMYCFKSCQANQN